MRPSDMLVQELIELGRSQDIGTTSIFASGRDYLEVIGKCRIDSWIERLDDHELELVIKGLVLLGASQNVTGISVTPVPRLYTGLVTRAPERDQELTMWIKQNTTSRYEPFGLGRVYQANSYAEFVIEREEYLHGKIGNQSKPDTERGARSLLNAVKNGDIRAVKHHIDNGEYPYAVIEESDSLLTVAIKHGRDEVADFLRSLGVSAEQESTDEPE